MSISLFQWKYFQRLETNFLAFSFQTITVRSRIYSPWPKVWRVTQMWCQCY